MALLEVKNLTISFHHEEEDAYEVVKDVSFNLEKGEVLGIVGESGSGKTLTALSVAGLLPYPKAFHSKESSIRFNKEELIGNPDIRKFRGKNIGFVFQEPMSSLNPLHTVGWQIAETLIVNQKLNKKLAFQRTLDLLKMTGISQPEERIKAYPHELSGGQRQRVMIAMAIANNPDILIADEPTTALDVTIAAEIIELLLNLKKDLGMSIIFISHDLGVVHQIADRVLVMKNGKIVEQGSNKDIFERPKDSYTKSLIYSSNILKNIDNTEKEKIIKLQNIFIKYPLVKNFWGQVKSYLTAVNDVSLTLQQGKTLGVVGESGSGKTTLGMALAGLNKFTGRVLLENVDISSIKSVKLRKSIQVVFQDPYNSLNPRMTVAEIIEEGIRVHFPQLNAKQRFEKAKKTLLEVGLKEQALEKYPHEFSGGQRQRIAIARALAVEPEVIVLDEPTSALDVTIAAHILKLLQKIQNEKGLTYLFISHDMRAVRAVADDIAVMKDGKIIEMGAAEEIFKCPKNEYTKKLIQAANIGKKYGKSTSECLNKSSRKV